MNPLPAQSDSVKSVYKIIIKLKWTFLRWFNILLYGFFGSLVLAYGGQFLESRCNHYISFIFGATFSFIHTIALWILLIALLVLLNKLSRTRLNHLKYTFSYPPLPIAVLLAIFLAVYWPDLGEGIFGKNCITISEAIIIAFIYTVIWFTQASISVFFTWIDKKYSSADQRTKISGVENLKKWIAKEEAIAEFEDDLFDHDRIADRIIDRLKGGKATIALQGEFGSGKTGVCNLVSYKSRNQKLPFLFAPTSCWGFEDVNKAQKEVLEKILDVVELEADCLAIRNMPDRYVEALGSHSGWLKSILQISSDTSSPLEQLKRLSPILRSINKGVVVFIENLDRTGPEFKIDQVQTMLMRFKEVEGISFVLAISPMQQIDFIKLCEYIEIMPLLDREKILTLVDKMRELLIKEHPPGIMLMKLDPLKAENDDYSIFDHYLGFTWPWQLALCGILNKPRVLKHALRHLYFSWPKLKGEVHFDDLLSITALRTGAPDAWMFFSRYYQLIQGISHENNTHLKDDGKEMLKKDLKDRWNTLAANGSFDARSAAALLRDIYSATNLVTGAQISGHQPNMQSMQSEKRRDVYARRLLTENIDINEVSDQKILSLIQNGKSDAKALAELAEIITDSIPASKAFEDFANALEFNQELALLTEIYSVIRKRYGASFERHQTPGFFAPWRRIVDNRPPETEKWLLTEISKCIPAYLTLLTSIYYFFFGTNRYSFNDRITVRKEILDQLKKSWENITPEELAAGFDPVYPYTLYHIIYTTDFLDRAQNIPYTNTEDWSWSGSLLLEACKNNPNVMIPQVLMVITKNTAPNEPIPVYQLDHERLNQLFGALSFQILKLIKNGFTPHAGTSQQIIYYLEAAKQQILKDIEQLENTSS